MNISFIIPTFNGKDTVGRTIESIQRSKLPGKFEIIVIDDCSKDNYADKLNKMYKQIIVIRNKTNLGAAASRNIGIRKARYDIMLFIDDDVILGEGTAKRMNDCLENGLDISFPEIRLENGKLLYPIAEKEKSYPMISACFAVKKSSLAKAGLEFDEYFETYLEDNDFFIRCSIAGLNASHSAGCCAYHMLKKNKGFEKRCFAEIRNLAYGIAKYRNRHMLFYDKWKKTALAYDPFKLRILLRCIGCCLLNFAWFNWQDYDRSSSIWKKSWQVLSFNNKISDNWLSVQVTAIKSLFSLIKSKKQMAENRSGFERWLKDHGLPLR